MARIPEEREGAWKPYPHPLAEFIPAPPNCGAPKPSIAEWDVGMLGWEAGPGSNRKPARAGIGRYRREPITKDCFNYYPSSLSSRRNWMSSRVWWLFSDPLLAGHSGKNRVCHPEADCPGEEGPPTVEQRSLSRPPIEELADALDTNER